MNKSELLTDLESQTPVVAVLLKQAILDGTTSVQNETSKVVLIAEKIDNLTVYNVPILVQDPNDPDLWNKAAQPISVLNDGSTDPAAPEQAQYHTKKVWPQAADPFRAEVQTQADSFEGAPHGGSTVIKVVVNQVAPDRQAAFVTAYKADGSSINGLLYKDSNGEWAAPKILTG